MNCVGRINSIVRINCMQLQDVNRSDMYIEFEQCEVDVD